jgi:sulfate adenylyltransferase (ADP) / ATP adenylyltransferase
VPAASETHTLVLNKYPVIPNHFILATKENKPQTDLLEPDDLATTYALLHAWQIDQSELNPASDDSLFAFFNSGPHSGASQPHRHLQFLPVSDMRLGLPDSATWQPLISHLTAPSTIHHPFQIDHSPLSPFLTLSTPLSPHLTPGGLHDRYLVLLHVAQLLSTNPHVLPTAATTAPEPSIDSAHVELSYNLALTTERMAIAPRRAEGADVPGLEGSEVAVNGTVLGGTLMVKERNEWERLRDGEGVLDEVLGRIGFEGLVVGEAGKL